MKRTSPSATWNRAVPRSGGLLLRALVSRSTPSGSWSASQPTPAENATASCGYSVSCWRNSSATDATRAATPYWW